MKIAAIADIHIASARGNSSRRGDLGLQLLQRVVNRLNRFERPDVTVVLGDLVDDGNTPDGQRGLRATAGILEALESPRIVIPGNHDGNPARFTDMFGTPPEQVNVAGGRILPFVDAQEPKWNASRGSADLARTRAAADRRPGPAVTIQHVPVFPEGQTDCPYHYLNAEAVIGAMRAGGVTLALSGHYHHGFDIVRQGPCSFLACPALCEHPFPYLVIDLNEHGVDRVEKRSLAMPDAVPLCESHVHTQFAYCSKNMQMSRSIQLALDFGVRDVGMLEHGGQLYFDAETFWHARFMPEGIDTKTGRDRRVAEFLRAMKTAGMLRSRIGMEVDCDFRGRPVILPEDRARIGYVIGALHWVPSVKEGEDFDTEACADDHLRLWTQFIPSGIDVLAHPFRIYHRRCTRPPRRLFEPLCHLLQQHNVAAELNFHVQEPDPNFTAMCLDRGIRLALGTDAHTDTEVAEFWPHLRLLETLSAGPDRFEDILWRPE